jgi:ketosteroid isomerase-like protein
LLYTLIILKKYVMKQLLSFFSVIAICSVLLAACGDKPATGDNTKPAFDIAAAKKIIDSTNTVFMGLVAKSDSAGLAAMYTADGKMMGANMPSASGTSAIKSAFGGMFAAMGSIGLNLTAEEVNGNEEMVSEVGVYTMTQGGKEIDKGKYIVLWKMEDGKWKLHRDCFNSDWPCPPPPPTK